MKSPKPGYIFDYISGVEVKATPEEVEATQPFSKLLVEDYGYPTSRIVTRPQFRAKKSPSDKKGVPMDIVVFNDDAHTSLKMIVECKKSSEKLEKHISQLQAYMTCTNAEIGILYNGSDSIYINKVSTLKGVDFEIIPAIPKVDESLADIGKYYKSDLKPTHNLKSIFNEIRGWIVANGNVTRDETIASQLILLMLCKIYDERFTPITDHVSFRATIADTDKDIKNRIEKLFAATKKKYHEVIPDSDIIEFDGKTLRGVICRLQPYSIINTDRDCMSDAFEVFIGKSVKEQEGQFFTPRNVVKTMIAAINLERDKKIIDTACGSGGFLVESLRKIEELINKEGDLCGWSKEARLEEFKAAGIRDIRGLEKDPFLAKLSKAYMAILGDGKGGIFREDSLDLPSEWDERTQSEIHLGSFDYLLANPPFGKNIKVEGEKKLKQYKLAYSKSTSGIPKLVDKGNVSTLFLERNMQMLRDGGKMAIILPEPYFALPSYQDCIDFMFENNSVEWIIDLPHNTFRPHNNAKCCAIVIKKGVKQQKYINMAVAEYIGHDHQGKVLVDDAGNIKDDTNQLILEINERNENGGLLVNSYSRQLTFQVEASKVRKNNILVPRYYWETAFTNIKKEADAKAISFLSMQTLIDEGILSTFSGHGSPKGELKGEGDIPYIRVKDIVNWQPYVDITAMIPRQEYNKIFTSKKALLPKDILYVSRGSYRIGSVAMVSPYDGEMLLTREIIVMRMIQIDNKYGITPEYLLYALSHRYVWEQTKTKVFYEPCLPNIADRWSSILIPIFDDPNTFMEVKNKAQKVIEMQWDSKRIMSNLRKDCDAFLI